MNEDKPEKIDRKLLKQRARDVVNAKHGHSDAFTYNLSKSYLLLEPMLTVMETYPAKGWEEKMKTLRDNALRILGKSI